MAKDYLAMAVVVCIAVILFLIFVRRNQIRKAFFAVLVAQLFSWPITLLYTLMGWQYNPVRLFSHATDGQFVFAFIFHPSVLAVYYLHYPKQAGFVIRAFYNVIIPVLLILFHLLTDLYTDLIYYPNKFVLIGTIPVIFIIYNISRIYMDWFFNKIPDLEEV